MKAIHIRVLVDIGIIFCILTATKDDCAVVPNHRLGKVSPVTARRRGSECGLYIGRSLGETVGLCVPKIHFVVTGYRLQGYYKVTRFCFEIYLLKRTSMPA